MAHSFSEEQLRHISAMIRDALQGEGDQQIKAAVESGVKSLDDQTRTFLGQLDVYHAQKGKELERRTDEMIASRAEMLANQVEIVRVINEQKKVVDDATSRHAGIEADLDLKQSAFQNLADQMAQHEVVKERILSDLNMRQKEMEQFKEVIEALSIETLRTINEVSGGWKEKVEESFRLIEGRMFKFETSGPANFSGEQGKGNRAGAFDSRDGLIADKDRRIPEFPGDKVNVDEFRKWLRQFTKYCETRRGFPAAEIVFKAIRATTVPIDNGSAMNDLLQTAQGLDPHCPIEGTITLTQHWTDLRMRELFDGLEYALGDKCSEMLNEVTRAYGYELSTVDETL